MTTTTEKMSFVDRINKIAEPLTAIGRQKHLSALRDGMALSIPVTIAGAIAILFITVVFGGWGAQQTSLFGLLAHAAGDTSSAYHHLFDNSSGWYINSGTGWANIGWVGMQFFSWINQASLGIITVYATFQISYVLAHARGYKAPALVGGMGLGTYMVLIGGDLTYLGGTGMLAGIIGALAGAEAFLALSQSGKLEIKMPAGVPPAVGRAFAALLPGLIVLGGAATVNLVISLPYMFMGTAVEEGGKWVINTSYTLIPITRVVNNIIQEPFMNFARDGGDTALLIIWLFLVHTLWFAGIHGPNTINTIMGPISGLLVLDNMMGGRNVATGDSWNGFLLPGGSGGTLPLILLCLVFMKKGSPTREVAKFALPAGIFEINEPVIFGFPVTFNPIWGIPFVVGPMLASIWLIIFVKSGWMRSAYIGVPWTMPFFLMGLITTGFDPVSLIVSLLTFATLAVVYFPFVLIVRSQENKAMGIEDTPVFKSKKSKAAKTDTEAAAKEEK